MRQLAVLGALQAMVDELAERLGRSVVVNDPGVMMICASRHFGDEDQVRVRAVLQRAVDPEVARFVLAQSPGRWSGPGMLAASADLGLKPRLCVPLRDHGVALGLLMVIDEDQTLQPCEIDLITQVSARMSAVMYADHVAADATRIRLQELVAGLLGPDPERRTAARQVVGADHLLSDGEVVVTVVTPGHAADPVASFRTDLLDAVHASISVPSGSQAVAVLAGLVHLLQIGPADPATTTPDQRARQLATSLHRRLRTPVVVGVGGPQPDLNAAWRSAAQARVALRVARHLPQFDGIGVWNELGDYAVLGQLEPDDVADASLWRPLRQLAAGDPGGRLRATLTAYLDHAGSIPRTAGALHLHRTSLYYRLNQIATLCGVDLDDGATRFRLHLALRLRELDGADPTDRISTNRGPEAAKSRRVADDVRSDPGR